MIRFETDSQLKKFSKIYFNKSKMNYRVYENREVFKLPDGETIDFFINIIRGLVDLIPKKHVHTFLKSVQNV